MTRRLLLLVLLAAGLGAACAPIAPPPPPPPQPVSQYCAPSTPNSAGAYQAAFDNLRLTYTEWASADGAVPVTLPGGRTLWLFGDTFIGPPTANGAIPPGTPLVSNSAVLQTGRCFKPLMGGPPLARSAWIPDPAANEAYWPASAIVDEPNGRLYVFLLHVDRPANVVGTRIATFSLSTLGRLNITGTLPGTSTTRPYGSTAFSDAGFAYMYSSNSQNFHVARAPIASVRNQSTWEYWVGPGIEIGPEDDTWSGFGDANAAQALAFVGTPEPPGYNGDLVAPIAPLRVVRHGDGFLGTAMLIDWFSPTVSAFTAPAPQGPWTYASNLATTPSNVFSYGAQTLTGLQGGAPPILGYNTNVFGTPSTIWQYGPRFVTPANLPAPMVVTTTEDVPATSPSTGPPTSSTTTSSTTTSTSTSTSTTSTSAPP